MATPIAWTYGQVTDEPERHTPPALRAATDELPRRAHAVMYHRDAMFVDAMRSVLEDEAVSITEARCPEALVDLAATAEVAVIDMRLAGALDTLCTLAEQFEHVRVVAMTDHIDARGVRALERSGADVVVSANDGLDRLVGVVVGEDMHERAVRPSERGREGARASRDPRRLTVREAEVLEGLMRGDSTKRLAARLGISQATTRTHIQSVLTKFGVHTRLEAVALATSRSRISLVDVGLIDELDDGY